MMETLTTETGNQGSPRTEALKKSTSWMGTGAKRSFGALNEWVREPGDKQKIRGRLGWVGVAILCLIVSVADNPLPMIGALLAGFLILFAVMALYGDVLLNGKKEKAESEDPETTSNTADQGTPEDGIRNVEVDSKDAPTVASEAPAVDLVKRFVDIRKRATTAASDPVDEGLEGVVNDTFEMSKESAAEELDAEEIDMIEEPSDEPSVGFLESEPTRRLEDTATVRLREARPLAPDSAAPQPPVPQAVEPPAEHPVVTLEKGEQSELWSDPSAPLGGRIRLLESSRWVSGGSS
ncbi:hypothetical protein ABT282_08085 [Streptomyces sp. NPDC000927]|uniref:hypothetical protein n=1 Tax=Streptomyces sp. NPDC000927 TaxID=3154371 RepID=UPI00332C7C37